MKRLVIATCKIRHNPDRRMKHSGKYDEFGNPILRSDSQVILPRTLFEVDERDESYEWLLEQGAIEIVEDPGTIALWESGHRSAPAAVRPDSEFG
jgi:hypothetical protein